jgi:PAS domain S-box-containing protein
MEDVQRRGGPATGLREGDIPLHALLEALTEGVIIVNSDGDIVLANQRAEEMFTYERDKLVGHPLSVLLPERFVEMHKREVTNFFRRPRSRPMGQGFDLVAQRKNGEEFPVEISLSHLQTGAGSLAMAFITDITPRKQAEDELKRRSEDLDAFAHTVAHDLQASVSLLVGYAELLLEDLETLPPEQMRAHLDMMVKSGRKVSTIIQELLLFARIRKEDIKLVPLDMASIVGEAMGRLRNLIQETGAEIILPDSYPCALGHPSWVEEVWFNYLSNALKYGGHPPHLEIGGTRQQNAFVQFWVKDKGPGLAPEQLAYLFTPYSRLDHSRGQGHGLGLSIARRIVEKLSGQVTVESELGRGSVFGFTLKAAD